MTASCGQVQDLSGEPILATIRSKGLFQRHDDGTLSDSPDGAAGLSVSETEELHLLTMPAGTRAVTVTDGQNERRIVQLPSGLLLGLHKSKVHAHARKIVNNQPVQDEEKVSEGVHGLVRLDEIHAALAEVDRGTAAVQDLSRKPFAALIEFLPPVEGLVRFPHKVPVQVDNLQMDFGLMQFLILPEQTRGIAAGERIVGRMPGGEPFSSKSIGTDDVRRQLDAMLAGVRKSMPEEIVEAWDECAPGVFGDYVTALTSLLELRTFRCLEPEEAGWRALEEAVRG